MPTIRRFEEIEAWQTARELTRQLYAISSQGAFAHDFGLRDQIRRAAVSIMSNIAEGFESDSQALFVKFLGYAKASAGEVRAQLYVALDTGYITAAQFTKLRDLAEKSSRQLSRFIAYLRSHPAQGVREISMDYEIDG
ncbi:MAG: four helix bundle protein [Anaerolineae bacterium]